MSIRSKILNFFLKKYIKNVQPPVEERSYIEARKMMNQEGYVDQESTLGSKYLQKLIFNKSKSNIISSEIYLNNIRTLHFTQKNFDREKCILYFHGGGYVAGSPETHQNFCHWPACPLYKYLQLTHYHLKNFPKAIDDILTVTMLY